MKSFLLKGKTPICKWGMIPPETYFFGKVPKGYRLAVNPHHPYCIIDIDDKGIGKSGFKNIPKELLPELDNHFSYSTPSGGKHIWIKYSGDKHLMNKTSSLFIDFRTENGYVCWYHSEDIRNCLHLIKPTSKKLNKWLENLFTGAKNER